MTLTIGSQIGSHEITALLGKGGMGEVYRARDLKLKREVAIKILPGEFSRDVDRVSRFQREAEILAALNHPNIAGIYDLQEAQGARYLVLELVEGETLADRITRGPIPLEEALAVATQICEALEAAHERGIIHRDLKPANVKLTPDGKVKVLDFGLAKALENTPQGATLSNSPTMLTGTMSGAIIGTAAYMSPEQARGKVVDRRSDIFALGCVLYEMLAGRVAFEGEDTAEILARVLQREPDWNLLPAGMPQSVKDLLHLCLEKNVRKRRCDAGDVRIDIERALTGPSEASTRPVASAARAGFWVVIAAALLVASAGLAILHFRAPPLERVFRLSVGLPENSAIGHLALSPDGRELALTLNVKGKSQLWLRSLESLQMQPLPGTDQARVPFWSADGKTIGFFADNKLKIVPAAGGPPQALCDGTGLGYGGTWNTDGVIVFASENAPLRRVNAPGGPCTLIMKTENEIQAALPDFLPDGKHFLYTITRAGDEARRGIYIASLDDPSGRRLMPDVSGAIFTPDSSQTSAAHILFLRNGVLMAQPFDTGSLQLAGDVFQVASQASFSATPPQAAVSASVNGVLTYLANRSVDSQLTWFDRDGKNLGSVGDPAQAGGVALSIDGRYVALKRLNEQGLWLRDLSRNVETRFTFPQLGEAFTPVLSPGGTDIVFSANGSLYRKQITGGEEEQLLPKGNTRKPSDWSRDGRFLLYTEVDPKKQSDIWYLPDAQGKTGSPVKFLQTDFVESQAQFSPDGRWVAYTSDESGTFEVYVRPFPDGPGKWRVSGDGGQEPRWRSDGKELFYSAPGGPSRRQLMAVPVNPMSAASLTLGVPQKLFDFPARGLVPENNSFLYSPSPGAQRFLINVLANTTEPTLNVIVNWEKASGKGEQ